MLAQYAQLLTGDQIQTIHNASLTILEEVGLQVRNEAAREIFQHHGCRLNPETGIVFFPRAVVEQWRQAFPAEFHFYGRDPKYDITLPNDRPVIATTGIVSDVLDIETGEKRPATSADIARIARLANELPGIDLFLISTLADDIPEDRYVINGLYTAAKNCLKPIRCGITSTQPFDDIVRLGEIIAGGKDAYRERPFFYFGYTPVISPLTLDNDMTAVCIESARRDLPAMAAIAPNGGVTAPLTLSGTLVVANTEFLAINILTQMVKEGTPLIYYTLPTTTDMRTGAYTSGGIESGILQMGCAQLARFYGVPSGGYAGATNAKLSDAQAGFEKGMSPVVSMLGGVDMLMLAGLIDALMVFSYPQLVIDSEIGEMIKWVHRGIPFDEAHLALDLIKEIGPGGMYIDHQHTFEHMRTAAYLPTIADRQSWQEWSDAGRLDTQARAIQRVRDILTSDNSATLSPDIDAEIRKTFFKLLVDDSLTPTA